MHATIKLIGGPADGREVRTAITSTQPGARVPVDRSESIPANYYARDDSGAWHQYVARTRIADDGDIIKADHIGLRIP